jgi:endoribonuclease Dicer
VGKDYQTLETIGDSALKLAVTVVVYNRYVAKDEGGLSARRMNSIDNQHLRIKAMKKGLQNHLFTEFFRLRTWTPPTLENGTINPDGMTIRRRIPRRALSDCIESLLGAAYLSGGFDAVLQTGDALGLCFGGSTPWHERYSLSTQVRQLPVGVLLRPLEEQLGYRFKHGQLLTQAVTHRSFSSGSTHCQEREEFLGDGAYLH